MFLPEGGRPGADPLPEPKISRRQPPPAGPLAEYRAAGAHMLMGEGNAPAPRYGDIAKW